MKTFVIEMENGDVMRGELYPEIAPRLCKYPEGVVKK